MMESSRCGRAVDRWREEYEQKVTLLVRSSHPSPRSSVKTMRNGLAETGEAGVRDPMPCPGKFRQVLAYIQSLEDLVGG